MRSWLFRTGLILISVGWLGSCSGNDADSVSGMSEAQLVTACDSLTGAFMTDLKGELQAALAEEGPAFAIGVCKETAPEIAAAHSQRNGWQIRRISDRNRNPGNAPSPEEAVVFARLAEPGAPPSVHSWLDGPDSDSTFLYVKAIRAGELCLMCHGDPATMDSALVAALSEYYPNDQATGYQAGDLRGAFVVSVRPEGRRLAGGTTQTAP